MVSQLSRGAYLFLCGRSFRSKAVASFSSRSLADTICSRSNFIKPSKSNTRELEFGFNYRGVTLNRGSELRNSSLVTSYSANIGRQYATHATAMEKKSKKMLLYLTGLVFAMVGCSYAAVPLYRRFCQATGYGSTVQRQESVEEKIARHAKDGTVGRLLCSSMPMWLMECPGSLYPPKEK